MIRDKVIFGGLIGVLSKIAMDIFQIPIWRMMLVKHPLAHYAASLLMDPNTIHHSLLGSVTSILADYLYGIFWGVVFVYFVHATGNRHLIYKGIVFGGFLWLFSFGGLRSLPIVKLRELISNQALYYLFFHLIYGLALGLSVKILSKQHFTKG